MSSKNYQPLQIMGVTVRPYILASLTKLEDPANRTKDIAKEECVKPGTLSARRRRLEKKLSAKAGKPIFLERTETRGRLPKGMEKRQSRRRPEVKYFSNLKPDVLERAFENRSIDQHASTAA